MQSRADPLAFSLRDDCVRLLLEEKIMHYRMLRYPRDYANTKPDFLPDREAIARMSKYNEGIA